MTFARRIAPLAYVIALMAAPHAWAKHPIPNASDFQMGVSTASDVIDRYGRPNTDTQNSDGNRVIAYARVRTSVKAATFVPIVGLFAGGASGQTETVSFAFGPDGKLKSATTGNTNVDCGAFGNCH